MTSHGAGLSIVFDETTTGSKVEGEGALILSLGELNRIEPGVIEIVPHEGVEVTSRMVLELHDYLELTVQERLGVLVNQKYAYSYTWPAMQIFGASPHIVAEALLLNGDTWLQRLSNEFYRLAPRGGAWQTEIFDHYNEALDWLRGFL